MESRWELFWYVIKYSSEIDIIPEHLVCISHCFTAPGVAYTRNLIHLYAHSGINEICQFLEVHFISSASD